MTLPSDTQQKFLDLYDTDRQFRIEVDRLLYGEDVADLRAALARISSLRRDQFPTGFAYEVAVRKHADRALGRLAE